MLAHAETPTYQKFFFHSQRVRYLFEFEHLQVEILVEDKILGLQVTVHDLVLVQVIQRKQRLRSVERKVLLHIRVC